MAWPWQIQANEIRIATLNAGLSRDGPGLLLRDIRKGSDPQIIRARRLVAKADPDVILLTDFDYDAGQHALQAFAGPLDYAHVFALAPNRGVQDQMDADQDDWWGEAEDAQGYGEFTGQGGMAILSRFPILAEQALDFSSMLWRDLPQSRTPDTNENLLAKQRLATTGHWDVPVNVDGAVLHLWAYYATTPVFDGPEDRNGLRNHDETAFWNRYLDGDLWVQASNAPFVILGDANLDPVDGEGIRSAIADLIGHERVQDPAPSSTESEDRALAQGGVNLKHRGDPALDTADWSDKNGPGNLRVDYVLPSNDFTVTGAGIIWPEDVPATTSIKGAPPLRHGLVWVDVRW